MLIFFFRVKMNLVIKLLIIISCIFIPHVKATSHHCCPNNGIISSSETCKDGSKVSLACEGKPMILNPSRNMLFQFIIGNDSDVGKSFLDAYNAGYLIYQPYFCIGEYEQFSFGSETSSNVAIVCLNSRKWYRDVDVNGTEYVQKATFTRNVISIVLFVASVLNFISAVLLLTTAAIYYALQNERDVQGTCYFYFSLTVGLGHSWFLYQKIFNTEGLLPNMCLSNFYIFIYLVLCGMCWSTVSSYHIWRATMNYHIKNEEELVKYYKIFGFGLPFLFIFLAWVHVHLKHIANLTFVLDCAEHQTVVIEIYFTLPVLMLLLANLLMFIHSQIRVWSLHTITLQDKKLTMKILKYRLLMNAKLFFVMGVPWAFLVIIFTSQRFLDYSSSFTDIIEYVLMFLILSEGLPIFVILVLFRKRVLRGIGNKWFVNSKIYPDKWKTRRDSETEEAVSDNETPARSPEAKFTVNINDENKSTIDDTVVVNL